MSVGYSLDEALERLEALSDSLGIPRITRCDGLVLYALAYAYSTRRSSVLAVDAGAGVGYSTLWIAKALADAAVRDGRVYAVESNPSRCARLSQALATLNAPLRLEAVCSDAVSFLEGLQEPVDILFIDVDKHLYTRTWELASPKLRPGGIALYHNARTPPARRVLQLAREAGWAATTVDTDPGLLLAVKPEK